MFPHLPPMKTLCFTPYQVVLRWARITMLHTHTLTVCTHRRDTFITTTSSFIIPVTFKYELAAWFLFEIAQAIVPCFSQLKGKYRISQYQSLMISNNGGCSRLRRVKEKENVNKLPVHCSVAL